MISLPSNAKTKGQSRTTQWHSDHGPRNVLRCKLMYKLPHLFCDEPRKECIAWAGNRTRRSSLEEEECLSLADSVVIVVSG